MGYKLLIVVCISFLLFSNSYSQEIIKTHAISLTDSIKYKDGFTHFDYVNPNAPKGGTFKRALYGTFDSLNPFAIKGISIKGTGHMYDTLLVSSKDEEGTYYGLVAETMEYPVDYSWVIFNMRKNAVWHDGKPLTAEDVVFSFNELTRISPFYKNYYALIEKAEAIDTYKVKFTFKKGETSKELPLIAGQIVIIPKHYWQNRDLSKSTLEIPLGSGPYKIESFDAGKTVTFKRVKNYWAEQIPSAKGFNNFDKIVFEYFRDQTVAFEAFRAGQFDFISEGSGKRWYRGYTGRFFDMGLIKKVEIPHKNPQGMRGIFMNSSIYPLNNILVRKALNYAYDYDWINKNIYFGQDKRFTSYFSNSSLACPDIVPKDVQDAIKMVVVNPSKELLSEPFSFPKTDGSGNNRQNLKKAVELLNQAGFKSVNGKMVDKNNKPLVLEIALTSKNLENELMPFKKSLERIGIELKILYVDSSQYVERIRNKKYMLVYSVLKQSNSPGNEQRGMWTSKAAHEKAGRNLASIEDPAVDKMVDLIITAPDRKSLVTYTQALDRLLLNGWYVIPSGYSDKYRIAYWDKFEMPKVTPEYGLSLDSWWINIEKEKKINSQIIR